MKSKFCQNDRNFLSHHFFQHLVNWCLYRCRLQVYLHIIQICAYGICCMFYKWVDIGVVVCFSQIAHFYKVPDRQLFSAALLQLWEILPIKFTPQLNDIMEACPLEKVLLSNFEKISKKKYISDENVYENVFL